jgi:translation initiation factor IF-2
MTEEQKKPKATLIKHRRSEPPTAVTEEAPDKSEKKKVVVVKKKVVVVKKSQPRPVEPAAAAPAPAETRVVEPQMANPAAAAPRAAEQRPAQNATPSQEGRPVEVRAQETRARETRAPQGPAREVPAPDAVRREAREPRPGGDARPGGPAAPARTPAGGPTPPAPEPRLRTGPEGRLPQGPARPYSDQPRPPRPGFGPRPDGRPDFRRDGGRPDFRPEGRGPGPERYTRREPGRPAGPRPYPPGGGWPPRSGPDRPGDARFGGPRPGPRPGMARPGAHGGPGAQKSEEEARKGGAKKIFKTKRKGPYVKKVRDEEREKRIQVKKKAAPRANPIPKEISIMESITVSELARKMNLKASELIGKLMSMGMMVTINQPIDAETATLLAEEYGAKVNIVSLYDETEISTVEDREEDLKPRPPIVTVMGHVDHGKTKLLDAIRSTNVVASEFGGITQHIGAYMVELPQGRVIFLDTPGHEAFTTMRARGAEVTDIVVLVVAADDGVMPQTVEAINHAKAAKVPIIVAVNKIDLPDANPDNVKKQLSAHELIPEDWGGNTLYVLVSALKKTGIDSLLESILLQAEVLELKANYDCRAEGRIIESKIDLGRGIVATVLIQRGTLRGGDSFVAGVYPGKVRAMFNDKGDRIEEATPSMPVEILGFTGIPNAGNPFQVTETEKEARQVGDKRQELKKMEEAKTVKKVTLDNLYEQIKEGEVQELRVIIKGDVHGSVEALQTALEKLSTPEIRLVVIHALAGAINREDVMLASTTNAIIIGFNVRPSPDAQAVADREKVEVRRYNVIYEAVDDVRSAMEGLLAPEMKEQTLGLAEVREVYKISKIGTIAGCHVLSGKIRRNAACQVIRDGAVIYRGKINSLKRFKDDVREVEAGYECGIGVENFNDIKTGDQIEALEVIELAKKLDRGAAVDGGAKAETG